MKAASLLALLDIAIAFCPRNSKDSATRSKCFTFYNIPMSYSDAEAFCGNFEGHLASVTNGFEAQEIWDMAKAAGANDRFWIGANDPKADHNPSGYSWEDQTQFNYTRWKKEEPNTANPCVSTQMSVNKWSTSPCSSQLPFICISDRDPVPTTPPPPQYCPQGSHYLAETKACYTALTDRLNFTVAEAECVKMGGHLTSIHSDTENLFVNQVARNGTAGTVNDQVWIGGHRKAAGVNAFVWTDGTPWDYVNWQLGEPDDNYGPEDCVQTFSDPTPPWLVNKWNDYQCFTPIRTAVCKTRPLL